MVTGAVSRQSRVLRCAVPQSVPELALRARKSPLLWLEFIRDTAPSLSLSHGGGQALLDRVTLSQERREFFIDNVFSRQGRVLSHELRCDEAEEDTVVHHCHRPRTGVDR